MKAILKIALFIIFSSIMSTNIGAQMKQKVADRLYDELAFFKAVELYQDLAKRSTGTTYHVRRTAECYRLIGDSKNAELWYAKLTTRKDAMPEDFYYYGQMLKSNENYEAANVQMEKFYEKTSGKDSRAAAHHGNENYADQFKVNADRFDINILDNINTEDSDFGSSYYTENGKKMMVFASARRNVDAFNKKNQWDNSYFLDVYTSEINQDGTVAKPTVFNKEVKSKYHEGPVAFTTYNGKEEMYLTRSNYLDKKKGLSKERHNNLQIYVATKESGGKWSELKPFQFNNGEFSVGHATLSADGKIMYFVSDMPKFREGNANANMGETDIWMCERKTDGTWDFPENVKAVNTEGKEMFPYLAPTGILYFASEGHLGLGGLDLFRAEPSGDKSFDKPLNMGYPLNTNYDDFALIVNDDETAGYFSSNREEEKSAGNDDIFSVKILYPFGEKKILIAGAVIDEKTNDAIADATVKIINKETGEIIKEVKSNINGMFELKDIPEGSYKIVSEKDNFQLIQSFEIDTKTIKGRELRDVKLMMKKNDCGLIGKIINEATKEAVEGAKVTIRNNTTSQEMEYISMSDGSFKDALNGIPCPGGMIDYSIVITKQGFFPKDITFQYRITKPGIVDLNEFIKEINLTPEALGSNMKDLCKIDEIKYDFNDHKIRPDAAAELDKLVECMNRYPNVKVEIGSHTDCRGKDPFNKRLSDKRAKSAMKYVISKGISEDRIFGQGYGEEKLIEVCASCYSCSEDQHQVNRRTEFRIVGFVDGLENNSSNSFNK